MQQQERTSQGARRSYTRLVLDVAAIEFDVDVDRLTQPSRARSLCHARWVAQTVLYERGMSQPEIARVFGHRDHTSVWHGLHQVRSRPELQEHVWLVKRALAGLAQVGGRKAVPV